MYDLSQPNDEPGQCDDGTTLLCAPIYEARLTGRMGALVIEHAGVAWRGELMLDGRMGAITRNGLTCERAPTWFQRRLARATRLLQSAYPPAGGAS